jgi:hypothetical protein
MTLQAPTAWAEAGLRPAPARLAGAVVQPDRIHQQKTRSRGPSHALPVRPLVRVGAQAAAEVVQGSEYCTIVGKGCLGPPPREHFEYPNGNPILNAK